MARCYVASEVLSVYLINGETASTQTVDGRKKMVQASETPFT